MSDQAPHVLILGSAPSAIVARSWARESFTRIIAINNAWRIRGDWNVLIHPEDFPAENLPDGMTAEQELITAKDYVPLQNQYGGFVYAGGTMAFTAGYWALAALRPAVLAYFGCDMVYPAQGRTHFYGKGHADPLRKDITLRSLEAKSARLALLGAAQGCRVVRLSSGDSRLVFPTATRDNLSAPPLPGVAAMKPILKREAELGYSVPSGRYWEVEHQFDPAEIDALDQLWLEAYRSSCLDQVA